MDKEGKKILILVPAVTARGGISNYYMVLKNHFSPEIEYYERGSRTWPIRRGFLPELIRAWRDYNNFKTRLKEGDISLVQSSTSLGLATSIRDGLFLRYARLKGIKTVAFFRGWDESAEKKVENIYLAVFRYFFFYSDCIIVLSDNAKQSLLKWGYKGEIIRETTLVDKNLVESVTSLELISKYEKVLETKKLKILFLSRLEKRKGIYEIIDAFKALKNTVTSFELRLTICGDGLELENIKNKVRNEGIHDINITGFVSGMKKKVQFEESDLFVFPSHGEGMPNAVLEAMGFGLPVITTAVGGIMDFFVNEKHGYLIEKGNYMDIVHKIIMIIESGGKLKEFSINNYELANKEFRSDLVASRIETIFQKVIKS